MVAVAGLVVVGTFLLQWPVTKAYLDTLHPSLGVIGHGARFWAVVVASVAAAAAASWWYGGPLVAGLVLAALGLALTDIYDWWHGAVLLFAPLAVGVLGARAASTARAVLVGWLLLMQPLGFDQTPSHLFLDFAKHYRAEVVASGARQAGRYRAAGAVFTVVCFSTFGHLPASSRRRTSRPRRWWAWPRSTPAPGTAKATTASAAAMRSAVFIGTSWLRVRRERCGAGTAPRNRIGRGFVRRSVNVCSVVGDADGDPVARPPATSTRAFSKDGGPMKPLASLDDASPSLGIPRKPVSSFPLPFSSW